MANPSKDLKETESTLRSVIQALIDGQEGFQKIGEQLKNETLKEYFLAESLTRANFAAYSNPSFTRKAFTTSKRAEHP